jgi:hypothetical protein
MQDFSALKVQDDSAKREGQNGKEGKNKSDKQDKKRRYDSKSRSRPHIGKGIRSQQQKRQHDKQNNFAFSE